MKKVSIEEYNEKVNKILNSDLQVHEALIKALEYAGSVQINSK